MPSVRHTPGHANRGRRQHLRGRSDRGAISLWVVLIFSAAFPALLGLVYDGGKVIDARLDATRAAAQAARAGADQLSQASIRSGGNSVSSDQAQFAATQYLHDAGKSGQATVNGQNVTVTVTDTVRPVILSFFGIGPAHISETETAQGIQEGN